VATHDYNLANQDGASFRSDLNNALAAIVSNNSSSTAPATTFAHQIWVDTTANVIKQRNAANDAWIELWRIDGGFNAKTFSSNVTLNAQSDLRFADSDSSNWVAFQAPATVASNVTWTLPSADGTADQALTTNGSGVLSWADAGAVQDNITEGNTSAEVVDTGSDGHFKVVTEGTEALRINNSQRVGIGDTDFDALLSIKGAADENTTPHIRLKDGSDTREAWITNNAGDLMLKNGGNDNTPHCFVKLLDGNQIQLGTANTERFRVGSSGELGIGGGTYGTSGQVLTSQGSGSAPQWATPSAVQQSTNAVNLSGAAQEWTSIPSTCYEIRIAYQNVSWTTGNSAVMFTLGDSGGLERSGYYYSNGFFGSNYTGSWKSNDGGFKDYVYLETSRTISGSFYALRSNNNIWIMHFEHVDDDDNQQVHSTGYKNLSGTLDRIELRSANNYNFDSGNARITYLY